MKSEIRAYNRARQHYLYNLDVLEGGLEKWDAQINLERERVTNAGAQEGQSHQPRWFARNLESLTREVAERLQNLRQIGREMDALLAESTGSE